MSATADAPEAPEVVRIDAGNAADAASLMSEAVGRFRSELREENGRWYVVLNPDRPEPQLLVDAIELTQGWLEHSRGTTATLRFRGRAHELSSSRVAAAPARTAAAFGSLSIDAP